MISALILAFCVALSSVESGFAPPLPTGRRTQYYYRYDDGGYKYGYDTGKGSYSKAVASASNEVQGNYAYEGPGGNVNVKYTAGKDGYLPEGPSSNRGQFSAGANSGSWSSSNANYNELPNMEEQGPSNASYSFAYNVGDQSRQEVSDEQGNIHGTYSFVSNDGITRNVEYEAGAEKGFVVKGVPSSNAQNLQPATTYSYSTDVDSTHRVGVNIPDGSYFFSNSGGDHSRQESADSNGDVSGSNTFIAKDGVNRQVNYEAGAERGFIASGSHLPSPFPPSNTYPGNGLTTNIPEGYSGASFTGAHNTIRPVPGAYTSVTPLPGRAYEFSYIAGDHSRHESSDVNGNVVGSFSFIANDDKINRKVNYASSAEKGFVAFGDHLPSLSTVGAPSVSQPYTPSYPHPQPFIYNGASQQPGSASDSSSDGSYSFSYNTGDQSRTESSDSRGNVIGSFSFITQDDGVPRRVDYEAGAEKGFIARGDHLPKVVPTSGLPATTFPFGSTQANFASTGTVSVGSANTFKPNSASDGSYSFGYNLGDQSRQEASDNYGNVKGSYSFVARDDGLLRKVEYEAGPIGFVASGAHLPLQPHKVSPDILISKPDDLTFTDNYEDTTGTNDASYSFSYNAGDHARQEAADSLGNVIGSFSFISKDDGLNRKVDYEAGAERGFIARGSHLPESVSTAFQQPPGTGQSLGSSNFGGVRVPNAGNAGSTIASSATKPYFENGHAHVKTFLTPNAHHKVGYIYDTQ